MVNYSPNALCWIIFANICIFSSNILFRTRALLFINKTDLYFQWGFQVVLVVKNLPANAGDSRERCVQSLGWEDLLEKEMATCSSILAREIPWSEESGRLQSLGLQRVGHDSVCTHARAHTHTHTHIQYLSSTHIKALLIL